MEFSLQIDLIWSRSPALPHQWTAITHLVLFVIIFLIAWGLKKNVSGTISQKIGTQLADIIDAHVAVKEKGVVITSLPGSKPNDNKAVVKPDVAELTDIQ